MGNFPGVTVDVLEAAIVHEGVRYRVVDLPGLHSLRAKGDTEEAVARRFLDGLRGAAGAAVVVQVMDGSTPALGLRLTRELAAEGLPLVLALTRRDVLDAEGRSLDVAALEDALGVRAVLVDARDPRSRDAVLALVRDAARALAPRREREGGRPRRARRRCLRDPSTRPTRCARAQRTARLDRWLLHPWWGPLLFVALMGALFSAVFLVADPASAAGRRGGAGLAGAIEAAHRARGVASFVVDGVLGGAGTVLTFLPQIVLLTVAMEFLDASGYLARGVFLVDRLLRRFGLGGRSFVPLLTGHACAIPAIGATRIIRDPGERLAAILVIPLMTCSARIPTYGVLIKPFFDHARAWFPRLPLHRALRRGARGGPPRERRPPAERHPRSTSPAPPGDARLPAPAGPRGGPHRGPRRGALRQGRRDHHPRRERDPLGAPSRPDARPLRPGRRHRATSRPRVVAMQHSVAAGVGRALEPVTRAAGFDWRINIGLVASFGAREFMVGTLGVIFGIEDADDESVDQVATALREARDPAGRRRYTAAHGLALMAFFVVACQCVSTFAAVRRETRSWRWPLFTLAWTYAVGFGLAVLVFQVARALGG